jgi:polyhydroxyalkanoate synthesis repressor PhaR
VATVLIKKYGNRRLYDTGDSRYVTLEELAAKIRSGSDLRVVDAQTGEDLTQATLTQIVLEAGNAAKFLPVQLLTQMIRLSDDALAEFFSRYVTGALEVYLQAKRGVQTLAGFNPLAMWMNNPFAAGPPPGTYGGYGGGYVAPPPPPVTAQVVNEPPESAEPAEPSVGRKRAETGPVVESSRADEVAAMRRELEELKEALREGLGAAKKKKRKP